MTDQQAAMRRGDLITKCTKGTEMIAREARRHFFTLFVSLMLTADTLLALP
jgi:hypothetical protein